MQNEKLHKLNFRELLGYPQELQPRYRYDKPLCCDSYCTDCETKGILATAGGKLTEMSHGCDSLDFEAILGPMVNKSGAVRYPIMFLLLDPGGDYGNGAEVHFNGFRKKPPVNHYYWSPSLKSWPQSIEDVVKSKNLYGSYFAYIMQKHLLANVYITNLIKCKMVGVNGDEPSRVEQNCVGRFLEREIEEFSPTIIFCFGCKAFGAFRHRFPHIKKSVKLLHPATRRPPFDTISKNDLRIDEAIKSP